MTADIDAFHAAVYADLADPLPRLVYADWLDDHGEAEYAELVRVWHRIDQRSDPVQRKEIRDRRHQLVRRLDEHWGWPCGLRFLGLFEHGLLPDKLSASAGELLDWRRWPVFLRPRELSVSGYAGKEAVVLRTPPVVRASRLYVYAVGEDVDGPPYPPVSDPLLAELSRDDCLPHLRSLLLRAVQPRRTALVRFAGSSLASRLTAFGLSFAMSRYSHREEQFEADGPAAVATAVGEFLDMYGDQLPP